MSQALSILRALRKRRKSVIAKAGFSLVEILVVLAIIAMLVAVVGPQAIKMQKNAKVRVAGNQVSMLKNSLDTMQLEIGRYPTEEEGLALLASGGNVAGWAGPYVQRGEIPKDPWNNDYRYRMGPDGEPQVGSFGEDGREGGEQNNADIWK